MNPRERERVVGAIATQCRNLLGPVGLGAFAAAMQLPTAPQPNLRGRSEPGYGSPTHSDPTAVEAKDVDRINFECRHLDADLNLALECIDAAVNRVAKAQRQVQSKEPEKPPQQKPLRGCESCARVSDHRGDPLFVPVAEGRYSKFCRDCGEWKAEYGHVPPLGIVEHWKKGYGKPNTKVIREAYEAEGRTAPELKVTA